MTREELKEHCKRQIQQFERVEKMMPVTPNDWKRYEEHKLVLELLEQGPTTKNDLGDDCVSRILVQSVISKSIEYKENPYQLYKRIENLPSVTPQEPKTGHWINKQHLLSSCSAECSSCHKRSNGFMRDNGFSLECKYFNYCPNCGIRMVNPQESEDNND